MSYSLRLKGFFLGSVLGLAAITRLTFAASIGLVGPLGGVADYTSELSLLIAIFAASRLSDRLNSYYENRSRRLALEKGFVKWVSELEAKKSAVAVESVSVLKKAA